MASLTTTSPAYSFAIPRENYAGYQFGVPGGPLPNVAIHYRVDSTFYGAFYAGQINNSAVWTADQAWAIQGLGSNVRFLNDQAAAHYISHAWIDGEGPSKAFARGAPNSLGCRDDGARIGSMPCEIRIEATGFAWNTVPENNTPPGWHDLTGVLVHEMGHWVGIDHSCDHPGSDGAPIPSVQCYYVDGPNLQQLRTIQADDVNALRVARPIGGFGTRDFTANGSFDSTEPGYSRTANSGIGPISFTDPGWGGAYDTGWGKIGNSGVWRDCVHSPAEGPCFMAIGAGAGAQSIYQDIAIWDGNYIRGYSLIPSARLRSPWVWGSASIVIRNLDTNGVVYQRDCSLPPGQWVDSLNSGSCWGSTSLPEPSGTWIRFEIYNTSNTNLDIDRVRLPF